MPNLKSTQISKQKLFNSPAGRICRKRIDEAAPILPLLQLQQNLGNRAVGRLIQAKLTIGAPGDKYEQEADHVAETVMRIPEPEAQRQPKEEELRRQPMEDEELQRMPMPQEEEDQKLQRQPREEEETLQRMPMKDDEEEKLNRMPMTDQDEQNVQTKSVSPHAPQVTPRVQAQIDGMRGSGKPLPETLRASFAPRFGYDFSGVRVHTDSRAAETSKSINARAFTVGGNIAFGAGQYAPETSEGRRLLSHELTHVIQQTGAKAGPKYNSIVQREQKATNATSDAAAQTAGLSQLEIDEIVKARILQELEKYNNLKIVIVGAGTDAAPGPISTTVTVRAVYFINSATHLPAIKKERKGFSQIKKALQNAISLLESSKGEERSIGRIVEAGKGTPEEIQTFVQTAVDQGVIEQYAKRKKKLNKDQQLVHLGENELRDLIQTWIKAARVGVDCSGLVLETAIRAREDVRSEALRLNKVDVPPEISHEMRRAKYFRKGSKVEKPADLRPGDAWVVRGGEHIRIVADVRPQKDFVEFDTAESSGTKKSSTPGPVQRIWRTENMKPFKKNKIKLFSGLKKGGSTSGSFHRIS